MMNVDIVLRVPAITLPSRALRDVSCRSVYRPLTMIYRVEDESKMYYLNLRYTYRTDMFRGTI